MTQDDNGIAFLGQHGIVRDAKLDSAGRAIYCRDECACSHCHVYSVMLRTERARNARFRSFVIVILIIIVLRGLWWLTTIEAPR